jgi:cell division cycle 20-like protein 1, cofactor of APC complex
MNSATSSSTQNQPGSFKYKDNSNLNDLTPIFENLSITSPNYIRESRAIQKYPSDRFIPSRSNSKLSLVFTDLHPCNKENSSDYKRKYTVPLHNTIQECSNTLTMQNLYKTYILNLPPSPTKPHFQPFNNKNLLSFTNTEKRFTKSNSSEKYENIQKLCLRKIPFEPNEDLSNAFINNIRKISKVPYKVLDAPALQDDFYLNLIDWSKKNILAVGLSSCVYLWSAYTSKVTKLCDLGTHDSVTSVSWSPSGNTISIGTDSGEVHLWDAEKLTKTRNFSGHYARVGALAWNKETLSTGSRDKTILNRDPRISQDYFAKLNGHKQEVCGLKWSFDEQQLASGGNDNKLFVWNQNNNHPVYKFSNHTAAIKALAWSPHQHGLLCSGGGTADRTIRFWNTLEMTQLNWVDTGSQVCNLAFSNNVNEIVSTHGYSQNQVIIWSYPDLEKIATLTGHTYRVLYLAISPDGQSIVTGAGDETLRFWNVFPEREDFNESGKTKSLLKRDYDMR